MGVTGLWRLIEPSGKPVPLETLENKVLAVDISIWLHQAIKGFQDSRGAPLPNAHLLGIYHRVCKLLYFRIKPIFVFDGGVPILKRQTIEKRNQLKSKTLNDADKIQKQLINTLLKHSAINKVLAEQAKTKLEESLAKPSTSKVSSRVNRDEIFKLPEIDNVISNSSDEESESTNPSPNKQWDIHTIDERSPHFQSLPADIRHEILTELKETRKQSSWDRIHEIPKESGDFSTYQMKRLLKRFSIQASLEEAEKEMGGHSLSIGELEALLQDQGVVSKEVGRRIASDENTRFLLIKDIKKAMENVKKQEEKRNKLNNVNKESNSTTVNNMEDASNDEEKKRNKLNNVNKESNFTTVNNIEDASNDEELQKAIQLSLQCETEQKDRPISTNDETLEKTTKLSKEKDSKKLELSFLNDSQLQISSDSEEEIQPPDSKTLSSAKNYMVEYSGLTPNEIDKIIGSNSINAKKLASEKEIRKSNEEQIIEKSIKAGNKISSIDNEKSVAITFSQLEKSNNVELMSDDSDFSDEFLEVSTEKTETLAKTSNSIEITIQPADPLGEDLFSDIFADQVEVPETSNKHSVFKNPLPPIPEEEDSQTDKPNKEINESNNALNNSNRVEEEIEKTESESKEKFVTVLERSAATSDQTFLKLTREQNKEKVVSELLQTLKIAKSNNVDQKSSGNSTTSLDTGQLREIQDNLIQEQNQLMGEKSSKERLATNITDQMYQEAQELLQFFGVPYIIAPMEAEAQCAFLDLIDLTDGTITDDSDIWLFGGKTVYKNFFNQSKHVLEFKSEEIQHHFKLSREQMILLALLVGSDYTVGISGIGPVTALEILATFPPPKVTEISLSQQELLLGLTEFRSWLLGGKATSGKATLRNKLKNVVFTENFPSYHVVRAYLDPTVDTSKEPFHWAKPDIVSLTDFAKEKFGWTRQKSEEILKPVVKRMEEKSIQKSIREYFKTKYKLHSIEAQSKMSKRVLKAVHKIGNEGAESPKEEEKAEEKSKKKTRKKKVEGKCTTKKKNNVKKSEPIVENDEQLKLISADNDTLETQKETSEMNVPGKVAPLTQRKTTTTQRTRKTAKNAKNIVPENSNISKSSNLQKIDNRNTGRKSKTDEKELKTTEKVSETTEKKSKIAEKEFKSTGKESRDTNKKVSSVKVNKGKVSTSTWSLSAPATEEIITLQDLGENVAEFMQELDVGDLSSNALLEGNKTENAHNSRKKPLIAPSTNGKHCSDIQIPSTSTLKRSKSSNKLIKKQKTGEDHILDEEMIILNETLTRSKSKVEQIRSQLMAELNKNLKTKKEPKELIRDVSGPLSPLDRLKVENIHKNEAIPQKEQDRLTLMRNKMKAIEIYKKKRQSVKKKEKVNRLPHSTTHYLSESSSDDSNC